MPFFLAIDAPGGFLFEWWSVFWDIFIARTNEKHSDAAASYIEVRLSILHRTPLSLEVNEALDKMHLICMGIFVCIDYISCFFIDKCESC